MSPVGNQWQLQCTCAYAAPFLWYCKRVQRWSLLGWMAVWMTGRQGKRAESCCPEEIKGHWWMIASYFALSQMSHPRKLYKRKWSSSQPACVPPFSFFFSLHCVRRLLSPRSCLLSVVQPRPQLFVLYRIPLPAQPQTASLFVGTVTDVPQAQTRLAGAS